MADAEKVISALESAIQYGPHYCGGEFGDENEYSRLGQNVLMDALALLKAQEPVEPYGQYSVHTGTKYIVCGACEKPLCKMKDSYRPKYCPECGRMVKWHANEAEK